MLVEICDSVDGLVFMWYQDVKAKLLGKVGSCWDDDGDNKGLGVGSKPVVGQVECFSLIKIECCIHEMRSHWWWQGRLVVGWTECSVGFSTNKMGLWWWGQPVVDRVECFIWVDCCVNESGSQWWSQRSPVVGGYGWSSECLFGVDEGGLELCRSVIIHSGWCVGDMVVLKLDCWPHSMCEESVEISEAWARSWLWWAPAELIRKWSNCSRI